jgi:hypothetical protein
VTSLLDKLNLRPQERRLVVIVALVVFVVLNIWLIWPEFGSVGIWENRRDAALKRLKEFKDEVARAPVYKKQLDELESQGAFVGTEEQALTLQRDVAQQALLSQVQVQNYNSGMGGGGGRTNAFFEEQTLVITVNNTGEKELVDFLYNLGARSSLIRVKSMTLSPDPSRMKLQGSITLVASFAKKPPTKAATPVKATNPPAAKPPTTPKSNAPPVQLDQKRT